MSLEPIIDKLKESSLTSQLIERIQRNNRLILTGGSKTAKTIISTTISKAEKLPLIVIVPTLEETTRWYSILNNFSWDSLYIYPTSENSPYESIPPTTEILWGQLQVLTELCSNDTNNIAIVTTERALQPHLPPKDSFLTSCLSLVKENIFDLDKLAINLTNLGYSKTTTTEEEGQWSRRGDILDIYPVNYESPIRLEFYGDNIDKIKEFDPVSQRSLDEINQVIISPVNFDILIANKLSSFTPEILAKYFDADSIDKLKNNIIPSGIRRYLGLAWTSPSSLIDFIDNSSLIITDEPNQCNSHSTAWTEHVSETYHQLETNLELNDNNLALPPNNLHSTFTTNYDLLNGFYGLDTTDFIDQYNRENIFDISSKQILTYPNQFGRLSEMLKKYQNDKFKIFIYSAQPSRTSSLLNEHDCISVFVENSKDSLRIKTLLDQNTPVALRSSSNFDLEGINFLPWKILLLTDKEFYGQQLVSHSGYVRRRKRSASKSIDHNKLRTGDYVVHRNHGIGKFIKIEKFVISQESRDYLLVQYQDGTLRVAADQLGSLGRYRSSSDKSPRIGKLGGTAWLNAKEKARKSINKVAIDLIRLYAERNKTEGYSFPPDAPWQSELEDAFQYEPTHDQLTAIKDVKNDMEKPKPMDRLVCGDVGYGKTEVAIRALFKAIISGKQAALLAPTTILSQQHWRTLSDRFAPYPIKIALLNRFKTSREKNAIVEELKSGTIDLVVGTHLILSNKVCFKDLGLLVVDEEQRFGVKQKERIKQFKKK